MSMTYVKHWDFGQEGVLPSGQNTFASTEEMSMVNDDVSPVSFSLLHSSASLSGFLSVSLEFTVCFLLFLPCSGDWRLKTKREENPR